MRFRTLLSLSLLVPLAATGAAVTGAMYANADRHSTEMAHKLLSSVTAQAGLEVYAHSEHAVGLARSLENLGPQGLPLADSAALADRLAALLRVHPNISWISFSTPAGRFTGAYRRADGEICLNESAIADGKTALVEQLIAPDGAKTLLRRDPDTAYDPRRRPFYVEAVQRRGLVWLPPYIFYEQGIPGISCAVPAYAAGGDLIGVFSVDYDLTYLSDLARRLAASPHSQVMVFTDEYLLLAHSALRVVQTSGHRDYGKLITPADVTDPTTQALLARLRKLNLKDLPAGQPQAISFDNAGRPQVACVLPVRLEEGPVMYVASVAPKTDFAPTALESSREALAVALGAFVLAGALAVLVARRVSAPVTTLVRASEEIGRGDLDVSVSLGRIDEFRKLSTAFHHMLASLRESVRVKASLLLAREIQRRLLPPGPPLLPGYDAAGFSASCDETGGDYYDFVVPDPATPSKLIVVLGDMMGHGLPSALMMASARGALRGLVRTETEPARLLTHLNDLLFRDTDGRRFMTMCLITFDLASCDLTWASAGHDPPIIYEPAGRRFHEPQGGDLPLGVQEGVRYLDYRFADTCAGQVLFVGSDGVWETQSPDGEQFGKGRVKAILEAHAGRSAEEIRTELLWALDQFRAGGATRDDVTFVIIRLLPQPALLRKVSRPSEKVMAVPGEAGEMKDVPELTS